jgi:hypothetical protein
VEKIRLNVLLLQGSVKALSYRTVKGGICFHVEQFVEFRGWYLLHDVQVVLSKSRLVELSGEQVMHLPYLLVRLVQYLDADMQSRWQALTNTVGPALQTSLRPPSVNTWVTAEETARFVSLALLLLFDANKLMKTHDPTKTALHTM